MDVLEAFRTNAPEAYDETKKLIWANISAQVDSCAVVLSGDSDDDIANSDSFIVWSEVAVVPPPTRLFL